MNKKIKGVWLDVEKKRMELGRGKKRSMKETIDEKNGRWRVRAMDEVGNYLCGFNHYVGMAEMARRKRDVGFLDVP